ncbi:MAG: DUF885 family protein [Gemmatimonadota bacterium]
MHVVLTLVLLGVAAPGGHRVPPADSTSAPDLVALYRDFRETRLPPVEAGVPDYSPDAMVHQFQALRELQHRLQEMDTAGWSGSWKVDYRLVEAEMRGMEFEHRVTRPWLRDPAFYAVINFQFGPKMHRAWSLPSIPLQQEQVDDVRQRLTAIPLILEQARGNLTEPAADLAHIAVYTMGEQLRRMERFLDDLRFHHPELVAPAEDARRAMAEWRQWLQTEGPGMAPNAGVGVEAYDWYLEHVMLLPYRWDDLLVLSLREYEEAVAALQLRAHANRHTPVLEPVASRDAYGTRFNEAMAHYHRFLVGSELFTLPDYLGPPPIWDGSWSPETRNDYFQTVMDRYTLPLSGHGRGHTIDAEIRARDERPIRGQPRLYFVDGVRQEAFAIGKEKFLYAMGLVDDIPRAHELMQNLRAFRAARAVADLRMHSNEQTFQDAFQYVVDHTPQGWVPMDSPTLWHDLELYLRTPLYGVGYVIGPIQIERLLTEAVLQRGDDFHLTEFMDEFLAAGLIPLELVAEEILGTALPGTHRR